MIIKIILIIQKANLELSIKIKVQIKVVLTKKRKDILILNKKKGLK